MTELKKSQEITDLNFEGENPHIAICHESQGWSANKRHDALFFKSKGVGLPKDIIKSLEGTIPEQVITKMSYQNMRSSLEEALENFLKENMSSNGEYIWVDVYDFNDDMVAFRFQEQLWAVDYTATEDGVVTIGEDLRVASRKELYVDSDSGEELIKASFWKQEDPLSGEDTSKTDGEFEGDDQVIDSQDTPQQKEVVEEESMTTEVNKPEATEEAVVKSQAELADIIKQAIEADRAEQAELRKQEELTKSTSEILKGMDSFVDGDSLDTLVKAVLASEDGAVIMETLSKANDAIVKAKEDAQAEITKVKEEFGKPDAIEDEPKDKIVKSSKRNLDDWVAANKSK